MDFGDVRLGCGGGGGPLGPCSLAIILNVVRRHDRLPKSTGPYACFLFLPLKQIRIAWFAVSGMCGKRTHKLPG